MSEQKPKKKRGFGSMDPRKHEEIARMGGEALAKNREYMREIGSRGGKAGKGKKKNRLK